MRRGECRYLSTVCRRCLHAGDAFLAARDLKQPPTDALTFEAWVRTGDDCADGTLLSYSVDPRLYPRDKAADNEFTIFSTRGLLVCRGFQWYRHPSEDACEHYYDTSDAGARNFADDTWHHVAATWTAANNGSVTIYKDGLLVARAETGKTEPIPLGGVWMLGAEQDCLGGCVDPTQRFHGAMDDVRLWRVARSQGQILRSMFDSSAVRSGGDDAGLVFYLDFDGPAFSDTVRDVGIAHNDLPLRRPPSFTDVLALPAGPPGAPPQLVPVHAGAEVSSPGGVHGSLAFDNTAAVAAHVSGFPQESWTVEMFVKMPFVPPDASAYQPQFALFSYGADLVDDADGAGGGDTTSFADNAILLQALNQGGYIDTSRGFPEVKRLRGNLDVWVNGRSRAGQVSESAEGIAYGRVVFDTPELADGQWHHLAVTWRYDDGLVRAYIDAREAATVAGSRQTAQPRTRRSQDGALVLGQDQDCAAGCFDTNQALRGTLAEVRVWAEERSAEDIAKAMDWPWLRAPPEETPGSLVARWSFDERSGACVAGDTGGAQCVVSPSGGLARGTELTIAAAAAPVRTLSDAPHQPLFLTLPSEFKPGADPSYAAGHAVRFQDGQALISALVANFPSDAFTVEFWMRSSDKCRMGTPFSYATGEYGVADNMLTITNYNNWQIAVAEDQGSGQLTHGSLDDRSGLGSTQGDWTHVAVTWESVSGATHLYIDGRLVWSTIRARGKLIAGGGVLVLGREQDCAGGCFGTAPAADVLGGQGQGAQDFRGTLDEVRLWRVARTQGQIQVAIEEVSSQALAKDPNLAAYWPMDEGLGHVVRDVTGHGNDLVLSRPDAISWVVSTVTEKREERAKARGDAGGSHKRHSKSKTRRKHRVAHALLTTLTVLMMLAAGGAALIWRHELGEACEPLAEHCADALRRLRGLLPGRTRQPTAYTSVVDDWDIGEPEMAAAEPFAAAAAYTPPPP